MIATSYHTHSRFCDGVGEVADYARAAIEAGIASLGASGHAPLPFQSDYAMRHEELPAYCAGVRSLAEEHRGRLRVHLGFELDFLPEYVDEILVAAAGCDPDLLVVGVHHLGLEDGGVPVPFDCAREEFEYGLRTLFGGNIRGLVAEYYARVRALAEWATRAATGCTVPPILAHLDLAKRWNHDSMYFDEAASWYIGEVEATLEAVARAGLVVEVNTAGWRSGHGGPYPSGWIVRRCVDLEIPVVVTSDAHHPGQVAYSYARAEALLRDLGCTETAFLDEGGWQARPLEYQGGSRASL